MPAFSQWQYLDPLGQQTGGVPGSASKTYPLMGIPEPWFRDKIDALRAARIPSAEYPDGYLGTVRSRRQDRLTSHGGRHTQRSYQRGVHVGSRVDPQAYFWVDEIHPKAGLEAQAKGERWQMTPDPNTHLVNDGKPVLRGARSLAGAEAPTRTAGSRSFQLPAEERADYLRQMRPQWRS